MPIVFQPVLACVQVSIRAIGVIPQNELFNVLHFQTPAAQPSYSDVEALVSLVDNWTNTVYRQNFANTVAIQEIRGKSRYASAAPFFNLSVSYAGLQGTLDEYAQAPLVLLHGPLSSRHQSGRFYAFPPGGDQGQTGYTDITWTNLVNALTNLKVSAASNGYQLAIASPELGTCTAVNSISHTNRLTYQKRRRPGFGR